MDTQQYRHELWGDLVEIIARLEIEFKDNQDVKDWVLILKNGADGVRRHIGSGGSQ